MDAGTAEIIVRMINIYFGHNEELMKNCRPLYEYSWLVNEIRMNIKRRFDITAAVDAALRNMPDDYVIRNHLMENKAEVRLMCITEYDEEKVMAQFRADGFDEGRIEGERKGEISGRELEKISNIRSLMQKLNLTAAQAMELLDVPKEKYEEYEKKLKE